MKFSELVRLLERNGFRLIREKGFGSILREDRLAQSCPGRFSRYQRGSHRYVACYYESGWFAWETPMIDLPYSLVIEATKDPGFFGFYSPNLQGFTGIGHSIEDCVYKARWGM